jgi:hypothetical protein
MENNPFGYDKRAQWQTPHYQSSTNAYPDASVNQQPGAPQALRQQQAPRQKAQTPPPARMPKARALALVTVFKKSLVVISLATFASFSGLVAYHQISTTASQKSSTSTTSSSSQQQNNTFFNQQGDNNLGISTPTATATTSNSTATATSGSSSGSNTNPAPGPASGSNVS